MRALNLYPHSPDDVIRWIAQRPEAMPAASDVVVIGGGIVGVASAYYLAKAGLRVVLLEKDRIASQQSGRNWGFVRTQYRDPAEMPLAVDALSIWPGLDRELGFDTGWRQTGCLFAAKDVEEFERFDRWLSLTDHVAKDAKLISASDVSRLMPAFTGETSGALYTETDGQAEPALATMAFARAAEAAGVQILEDCGAIEIETRPTGVAGVLTEYGSIRAGLVVCAAGATSYRLLRKLGFDLPQQIVRNTVSLTAPTPLLDQPCFCGLGLGLRQRADGSCILAAESTSDIDLTLGMFRAARYFLPEYFRNKGAFAFSLGRPLIDDIHYRLATQPRDWTIEPRRPRIPPNQKRADQTERLFRELFRGVDQVKIVKSWAGNIDVLPDALPVIDVPKNVPGLVVATGFSGHGFGLAPAVGKRVAELVTRATPAMSLDAFALDRFTRNNYRAPHAPL